MTFFNNLGTITPLAAVDPETPYLEDIKHFLEFRYPRSLEILGISFELPEWGHLGMTSPSRSDIILTQPLQYPLLNPKFAQRWSARIASVRKQGRNILHASLLDRYLQSPSHDGSAAGAEQYLAAAYSSGSFVEALKRTGLNLLFLHTPGEVVDDGFLLPAIEQLVGCYSMDHELGVHSLLQLLSRILALSNIPDFDTNLAQDFFGTQRAVHYLDEYDLFFGDQLGTATLIVDTPPDPLKPYRTTTYFHTFKVCEGYGHDEDSSHTANLDALQKCSKLHSYCRDLAWFRSTMISGLIRSERVLVTDFDVETYLQQHFGFDRASLNDHFDYRYLPLVQDKKNYGFPVEFRLFLCALRIGNRIESGAVHTSQARARVLTMRRLVVSLCERIPMHLIVSRDLAMYRDPVLSYMKQFYPRVPYDAQTLRIHLPRRDDTDSGNERTGYPPDAHGLYDRPKRPRDGDDDDS